MNLAPRCLAKTRQSTLCQSPAIRGKRRCRLHGGAKGSGAPEGNKNALKHGKYTAEALERRRDITKMIRETRGLMKSTGLLHEIFL